MSKRLFLRKGDLLTQVIVCDRILSQRVYSYGVNITKDDTKVRVVTFPHNPLLVEKIKTIPCHKWDSEKKYRNFPQRSCFQQNNRNLYSCKHKSLGKIVNPIDTLNLNKGGEG
jgi:hypothetical protein